MNFLEMNGLQTAQTHFKDIFQNNIHRDYADAMLDWLEQETDFFTAPSSTKYHGAHPGGLLVHSLNVYYRLRDIAIRDLADKEDPGKRRLSEEPGNWPLGGLRGIYIQGPHAAGAWREKPVPDPATHGPAAGGGPGDPVAHGRL